MVQKDYPLYETTVFKDFRVMTENVAKKVSGQDSHFI